MGCRRDVHSVAVPRGDVPLVGADHAPVTHHVRHSYNLTLDFVVFHSPCRRCVSMSCGSSNVLASLRRFPSREPANLKTLHWSRNAQGRPSESKGRRARRCKSIRPRTRRHHAGLNKPILMGERRDHQNKRHPTP